MAEFCFDCYKKYFDENITPDQVLLDTEPDLCEGCGTHQNTVIKARNLTLLDRLRRRFQR